MPASPSPRREPPSTYFVQDRSNKEELERLQIQSQMLTTSMGGVLPEQPDPTRFQRILDVGSGTGEWLIDVAKTYPTIPRLIGADISLKMVEYARAQARAQQVSDHVEFATMDALRALEFPNGFFDLVNQRFGFSYLRTWDWPKILSEFWRVTRPGGVIRLTEVDIVARNVPGSSPTPTLLQLADLQFQAFYQAGYFFTRDSGGVINELAHLLLQHCRLQNIQTRRILAEYRPGTPEGEGFYDDMRHLFRTALPFYRKWTAVPENYEQIYQQALSEMQHPDFAMRVELLTAWGTKGS